MRARIFLRQGSAYRFGCELEAADVDDIWRRLEAAPGTAGRRLRPGDVVYIEDLYWELNGDGGWRTLTPDNVTRALFRLIPTS